MIATRPREPVRFVLALAVCGSLFVAPHPSAAQAPALTKDQAARLLRGKGLTTAPVGLLAILQTSSPDLMEIVEAYLALGVPANRPIAYKDSEGRTGQALPLNFLLRVSCEDEGTALAAKRLIEAGADPGVRDTTEGGWTPAIASVRCPHVLREILAGKPDLSVTDIRGRTLMSYAVSFGNPREEVVKMLLDAGYNVAPERAALVADLGYNHPEVVRLLGGTPPVPPRPSASRPTRTPPASTAPKVDWKSPGPYPQRSRTEAAQALSRPGAVTTIDEHMWDGITSKEPLRLALALQAGANVSQRREATGYTPLVLLAERCDRDRDAEQQVSLAEQLIAAGADRTGVDANRANALVLAAGSCPPGVVQALLKAGLPPNSAGANGDTALKRAITNGRADNVALLLDAGVDPKKEPYDVKAFASGNKEIEELLKRRRK
jgi:ankyrin repeat protein